MYANRSLRLSQRRYCTTRREMLAAVVMFTHFRLYLRGAKFTLRMYHSSLRWLQIFRNNDGMLAHWHILLGQFSVSFEYRPGAQHANEDGLSGNVDSVRGRTAELLDQPFESSEMGDSMDADLLPRLSGETWVATTYLDELTADLPSTTSESYFIVASRRDETLTTVCRWVQTGAPPAWLECSGLYPELRCWWLQFRNLEEWWWRRRAPPATSSQLVVPVRECRELIRQYHDSLCGTFGCLPDRLPATGPVLLAGATAGCAFLSGQLLGLSGLEVPLPVQGPHGACRGGSPVGSVGHGPSGHVRHNSEGQPLCTGNR